MEKNLEEYIKSNSGFLHKLATYYSSTTDYVIEYEDLYQVGCLALFEKYSKYNKEKGSLSNYSFMIIRNAMLNYINSNNTVTHIPLPLNVYINSVSKKLATFHMSNGRKMTDEELLDYIKETNFTNYKSNEELVKIVTKVLKYHIKSRSDSLCEPFFHYNSIDEDLNEDILVKDFIKDEYNLEEDIMSKCFISEVINMLKKERKKDIDIFVETLGLIDDIPKTRRELAEKYNISVQAIDQRYKKTLKKVKSKFNDK